MQIDGEPWNQPPCTVGCCCSCCCCCCCCHADTLKWKGCTCVQYNYKTTSDWDRAQEPSSNAAGSSSQEPLLLQLPHPGDHQDHHGDQHEINQVTFVTFVIKITRVTKIVTVKVRISKEDNISTNISDWWQTWGCLWLVINGLNSHLSTK